MAGYGFSYGELWSPYLSATYSVEFPSTLRYAMDTFSMELGTLQFSTIVWRPILWNFLYPALRTYLDIHGYDGFGTCEIQLQDSQVMVFHYGRL